MCITALFAVSCVHLIFADALLTFFRNGLSQENEFSFWLDQIEEHEYLSQEVLITEF